MPALVAKNEAFSERVFGGHRVIGIAIAALAAMHIAAALQHYLITRDRVMQRMLPKALGGD